VIYSYVTNAHKKRRSFLRKKPKEVGWMKTDTVHLESVLITHMNKPQSSGQTEIRQGITKAAPAQTTSGGAGKAQGVEKIQPVKTGPQKK
jgi:hypothetical protein